MKAKICTAFFLVFLLLASQVTAAPREDWFLDHTDWNELLRDSPLMRWYDPYAEPVEALRAKASGEDNEARCQLALRLIRADGVAFAPDEGIALLKEAADAGHAQSQFLLGFLMLDGRYASGTAKEALELLDKAARQNNLNAMTELGSFLSRTGRPDDRVRAAQYLVKAAEGGERRAQYIVALMLLDGDEGMRDEEKGRILLRASAGSGFAPAQFRLALDLNKAHPGDDAIYKETVALLYTAALENFAPAMQSLAPLLPERNASFPWWQFAAERGDADSEFQLACACRFGQGVEKSDTRALCWLLKAALHGSNDALAALALCYQQAVLVPQDYSQSRFWMAQVRSTDAGNPGEAFFTPAETKPDAVTAPDIRPASWLASFQNPAGSRETDGVNALVAQYDPYAPSAAGQREEAERSAEAAWTLALRTLRCDGLPLAVNDALSLLEKAAAQEHAQALSLLGFLNAQGDLVPRDMDKAIRLLEKAASLDELRALSLLGEFYFTGDLVARDKAKAFDYPSRAAAMGERNALYRLGELYRTGLGVEADEKKALEYYDQAVARGCRRAALSRDKLLRKTARDENDPNRDVGSLFAAAAGQEMAEARVLRAMALTAAGQGNSREVVKLMNLASLQGHPQAQYMTAQLALTSPQNEKGRVMGLLMLLESALGGCVQSQAYLASCYARGQNLAQNQDEAAYWLGEVRKADPKEISQINLGF